MVGSTYEFWWHALERILLTGAPLPPCLKMIMSGRQVERATSTPEERMALHTELCGAIRCLPPASVAEVIRGLLQWAGIAPEGRPTHQVVNSEQLRRLAASPAIEIGAHTVWHPCLSALQVAEQEREISQSRSSLEALLDHPVRYFAYPYGSADDFTADTVRLVAAAGFEAGIANVQDRVSVPPDPFAVPRRLVRNWSALRFKSWLEAEDMGELEQVTVAEHQQRLAQHLEELQQVAVR
jgi:hypothetical protein